MVRRSAQRLGITLCMVLSLLFSQLALASYVCPADPSGAGDPATMEMAPGQPCEGMHGTQGASQQPVLCHQHCVNAPQSFDPVQPPAASLPAVVHVHVAPLLLDTGSVASSAAADIDRARPPPDPLFLSTLRLRV